jgi:hypothetical protein
MRRQLLWALAHGSPVLAVSETRQGVPDQVDLTADVRLTGSEIGPPLVMDLLESMYGLAAVSRHLGPINEIDAAALTINDLAIAVRPILASIDALAGPAARNREDRDGENEKDDSVPTRRLITQSPSERARRTSGDQTSDGDASSSKTPKRKNRSEGKPTGAEVVQPPTIESRARVDRRCESSP